MAKQDRIVVLDVGTTKVCVLIANLNELGLDVVGIGSLPSSGLRRGTIINIDSTVESIRRAVEEAELMAGFPVSNVSVGIAGTHVKSFNSSGVVGVRGREVDAYDVERVIDAGKAISIPPGQQIIHVIPQNFIIDEQEGIQEPVGMNGVRLEGKMHIVTASTPGIQNLIKCTNRAGLSVDKVILEPLASAASVIAEDEKELGVAMVDLGGGTADLCIYVGGALLHTAVVPIAGSHITNDIAMGLRTPQAEAEKLKVRYGCCLGDVVASEDTIEVPGVGGRKPRIVARKHLADIIEPRVEEIFRLLRKEIESTGYADLLGSGVVLTGGCSLMEGMPELAESILDMPVKRGYPTGVGGLSDVVHSPKFSTAVGLLRFVEEAHRKQSMGSLGEGTYYRVKHILSNWFKDLF